jgi:23S rRNA pseudouridine1911/1915/1917 synthase
MSQPSLSTYTVTESTAGAVLGALRKLVDAPMSWSDARKLMTGLKISVNGILCVDEGRRVVAGDVIEVRTKPLPPPPKDDDVRILFLDDDLVVADKPSGMLSLRHPGDVNWRQERKNQQPSLEECLQRLIPRKSGRKVRPEHVQLLAVHRIDRETSGVLVFARTEVCQEGLIQQFAEHSTLRRYRCIVPGHVETQTMESRQIRDRGDGLRGSCPDRKHGLRMVTHIHPLARYGDYSELECRLETGRTNQIRIHLSELGHPICGDIKYRSRFGEPPIPDRSNAPRLALHAMELGFVHPATKQPLNFTVPWPTDLQRFLMQLRMATGNGNK